MPEGRRYHDLTPLPRSFYDRPTLSVARELLGCYLVRLYEDEILAGRVVETEAYIGEDDPACHAARGHTPRTAVMYGPPGFAYIYFIYGMHHCLNAVTEAEGFPAAVLIRAIEPLAGLDIMRAHRPAGKTSELTNGPGKLCRALALDRTFNGRDLTSSDLFFAAGMPVADAAIGRSPRIGIRVARSRPWRFFLQDSPFPTRSL